MNIVMVTLIEAVTPERWQFLIKHAQEKKLDHYWEHDELNEERLEQFLIHVSSDSSNSEDGLKLSALT